MNAKVGGYTLLRVIMGINLFMHGAVRIFGDYSGFRSWVIGEFSGTILPGGLVTLTAWLIPPVELLVGISLVLGLWTSVGLAVAGIHMGVLMFGMSLLSNWGSVANQLLYVFGLSALLFGIEYNRFSLDKLWFES